jgi:hypothetical protein
MHLVLFGVLLFHASVTVQSLSPLSAGGMTAILNIRSGVEFRPTGNNFGVSSATASLGWFPKESLYQSVEGLRIEHFPGESMTAKLMGENIELSWKNPGNAAQFSLDSTVQTTSEFVPVKRKVPFPIEKHLLTEEMMPYLQAGKIANQSAQIQQLARKLVEGKDDLYHAVFELAEYVSHNTKYSLESEGQPAIQSASEVVQSKRGKCDEITALFVSLNRSLGIPCRFVAGYSYTENELFNDNWVSHSWSEVFFPGAGWVPFDITHGQFGYVDAGHIILSVSLDADPSNVAFVANGVDFELQPRCILDTSVNPRIMLPKGQNRQAIDIRLEVQSGEVGFGSDVVVVAIVRNTRDHYVATQLELATAKGVRPLNHASKINILMDPLEVIEIPYFFNVDGIHKSGYSYDYTFSLSSTWSSNEAHVKINVKDGAPMFYAKI